MTGEAYRAGALKEFASIGFTKLSIVNGLQRTSLLLFTINNSLGIKYFNLYSFNSWESSWAKLPSTLCVFLHEFDLWPHT